jgi:membrane protein YdbS with pleckstrin-like domain
LQPEQPVPPDAHIVNASSPALEPDDGELVDPRYVTLERLVGRLTALSIGMATFVVLGIVALVADDMSVWLGVTLLAVWLAAMGLLGWHAERWPALAYRHTRYRVDLDGIEIRRGVYWRSVTQVPRSRVQHTDVSQGPLERRYGLGTLVLYTAGTDHARVILPGLAHEDATALRDRLKPVDGGDAV